MMCQSTELVRTFRLWALLWVAALLFTVCGCSGPEKKAESAAPLSPNEEERTNEESMKVKPVVEETLEEEVLTEETDEAEVTAAVKGEQDKGEEFVTLQASKGTVTFPHRQHQETFECVSCHHPMKDSDGVATACRSCHGVSPDVLKAKDAFHAACKTCHEAQGGPTGCKDCHAS